MQEGVVNQEVATHANEAELLALIWIGIFKGALKITK